MKTCKEIMTTEPECCEAGITTDMIAQTMRTKNIGTVIIVDSMDTMNVVGIVTDRDLAIRLVAEKLDPATVSAQQVMTPNPVSCRIDDSIDDAVKLMEQEQIRRVPIVDEQGKLVGVISQGDLATRTHERRKVAELVIEVSQPGSKRVA